MVSLVQSNGNDAGLPEVNLPKVNMTGGAVDELPPETGKPLQITITKGMPAETKPATPAPAEQVQPTPEISDESKAIQEALHNGYTADELKNYLVNSKGISEDDADVTIVDSVKQKVLQAKQAGYSDEDVLNYMVGSGYDGNLADKAIKASRIDTKYKQLDYKPDLSEEDKAMDIADLYKNIYSEYSTTGNMVYGIFNDEAALKARRDINKLNYHVAEKLKKEGIDAFIDPDSGEVAMRNKQGVVSEVDSSILGSIYNSKGEFAGAVAGGIAGARGGAMAGAAVGAAFPPTAAISVPVGTAVGAIAGSMTGAAAGRGADLAINSMKLSEDLSAKMYMSQMKQAGIFDGVAGVVGASILKVGAKGYKGAIKGWKYFSHGNSAGAYKALKENLNITDDQAKEIISNWEKLNQKVAPGDNLQEKAVGIIPQTMQGAETAVKSAAMQNERVAVMLKNSLDERAKGIHKAVDTVADNNVGKFVREDLKAYEKDVKDFYDTIKKQAAGEIDGTDFRFDLDKLAIKPVMDSIEKRLSNPIARERFVSYASRIESASSDRTFSGLIELRAAVNDFKYSKSLSTPDLEALNTVINKIDGQIGKAVKEYMPETGKDWTANFTKAKSEYAKMKQLQENALYRMVNRPGATEHGIQQALSRYGTDKDVDAEVFNQLVTRLTPATRSKVEGAAIKNLVNKNTIGEAADFQAVHFPQLVEELKGLNLTTPEARNLVNVAEEIAKVYKNDVELSTITARTVFSKQSTLATSAEGKIKQGMISATWNAVYKYAPTKNARNIALVHRLTKVLENPLHVRTADELLREIPKEMQPEMASLIKQLQVETAKKGGAAAVQKDFVNMYKQSKSGNLVVSDGALGKGVYLVNKIKNPTPEMNVIKHEVNMSRMASIADISSIVGRDVTEKEIRNLPNIQEQLIDKGFLGIKLEDRAMLFHQTTAGVKSPKTVGKVDKGIALKDFVHQDNPGGSWLEKQQRYAAEDYAKGMKVNGAITAVARDIELPISYLKDLKGLKNEVRKSGEYQYDELIKSVDKEGFRKDSPILIGVNYKGEVFVIEGNTRIAVAKAKGIESIPVEVKYFAGGETTTKDLTLDKLASMAKKVRK